MAFQKKIWYAPHKKEAYNHVEIQKVIECLEEGWLAGFGPYTVEFEKQIAALFDKKHGVFVNSGSSAILLGLHALQLPAGSEVITPACTFATTVAPILQCGLKPVFCDVELGTYVPSVEQVLEKITENTRVILLPNLVGRKPDWKRLREQTSLVLFEDSADTITSTPETDVAITSFYASHLITACGSGGMVMFNDPAHVKRALMFRDWGRIGDNSEDMGQRFGYHIDGIPYDYKFLYGVVGYNMKSSEVNAAFGLAQLTKLENIKKKRRQNITRYVERLKDIKEIILPTDWEKYDWLAIPLMVQNDRMGLLSFLEKNDIQTRVCFAGNITRHPAYREFLESFPNSDEIMARGFLLGIHHGMTIDDVDYVCQKIEKFYFMTSVDSNIIATIGSSDPVDKDRAGSCRATVLQA